MKNISLYIISIVVCLSFTYPALAQEKQMKLHVWGENWVKQNAWDGKVWESKEIRKAVQVIHLTLKTIKPKDDPRYEFHWVLEAETKKGDILELKVLWEERVRGPGYTVLPPELDFPRDFTFGISEDAEHLVLVYLRSARVRVIEFSLTQQTKTTSEADALNDPRQGFNYMLLIPKERQREVPTYEVGWLDKIKIQEIRWQNETWYIKLQYGKGVFNFYWDKSKQSWVGKEEIQ